MKTILIIALAISGSQNPDLTVKTRLVDSMGKCKARMFDFASRYGQPEHIGDGRMEIKKQGMTIKLHCQEWSAENTAL